VACSTQDTPRRLNALVAESRARPEVRRIPRFPIYAKATTAAAPRPAVPAGSSRASAAALVCRAAELHMERSSANRDSVPGSVCPGAAGRDGSVSIMWLLRSTRSTAAGHASIYRLVELLHTYDVVNRVDLGDGIVRYEPTDPARVHRRLHPRVRRTRRAHRVQRAGLEHSIDRISHRLGCTTTNHEATSAPAARTAGRGRLVRQRKCSVSRRWNALVFLQVLLQVRGRR
jgi:hypothetical protein